MSIHSGSDLSAYGSSPAGWRNSPFCGEAGNKGDPDWLDAHRELVALHLDKSERYGQEADRLDNFTVVSEATARAPESYPAERIIEKTVRALNMIAHGEAYDVEEWMDIASLALCAEALRRRRENLARPGSPGRA